MSLSIYKPQFILFFYASCHLLNDGDTLIATYAWRCLFKKLCYLVFLSYLVFLYLITSNLIFLNFILWHLIFILILSFYFIISQIWPSMIFNFDSLLFYQVLYQIHPYSMILFLFIFHVWSSFSWFLVLF